MEYIGQLFVNGVIAGGIYALVAIGFAVIYRTVRFFNFAHGAVVALGAYVGYVVFQNAPGGLAVAALAAGCAGSVVGVAIDRLAFRPLRRRGSPPLVFLLTSFGVFVVVQSVLALTFGTRPMLFLVAPASRGYDIGIGIITAVQAAIVITAACATAAVQTFLARTRLGLAIRATSDDMIGARAVGIDPEMTIAASFAIGSFIAAVGGVLVALESRLEPTMGMPLMLRAIVACVVGGAGSIWGAVLGGILVGVLENVGVAWISAGWKDAIVFGLLVVFLLLCPGGLFTIHDRLRRMRGSA
jgi:branched-chain amino acid transport system permease protein